MARKSILDDYREELIELKDKLSSQKIADYIMDKYGVLIDPTTIANWYKQNGLSKKVKPCNGRARHGTGRVTNLEKAMGA